MTVSFTPNLLGPRVDERLAAFLDGWRAPVTDQDVVAAYRLLIDFILTGGKRVRPQLCYWGGGAPVARTARRSSAPPLLLSSAMRAC